MQNPFVNFKHFVTYLFCSKSCFQLLSANLEKTLDDDAGLLGFSIEDVNKEIDRAAKLVSVNRKKSFHSKEIGSFDRNISKKKSYRCKIVFMHS